MNKIFFHTQDIKLFLTNRKRVHHLISYLFRREKKQIQRIDYVFCSDDYLLELNRNFLKHNFYTDVITFDLSNSSLIIGEIYISVERVMSNAKFFKVSRKEEMLRVIIHGALHLCGYRDKKKEEAEIMNKKETEYLSLFQKEYKSFS